MMQFHPISAAAAETRCWCCLRDDATEAVTSADAIHAVLSDIGSFVLRLCASCGRSRVEKAIWAMANEQSDRQTECEIV